MESRITRKVETWIHEILYQRKIYPSGIFTLKKKFQVAVHISTFPDLSNYISKFVESCYSLFEKNEIQSISLNVFDKSKQLEKFVFEINPIFETLDINILAGNSIYTLGDLEQHLRACLLKLGTCNSVLKTHTTPLTFTLSIEKVNMGYPNQNLELVDWIPSDDATTNWNHLIPLKLVSMDILKVNTYVYEASNKGKEREEAPMDIQ